MPAPGLVQSLSKTVSVTSDAAGAAAFKFEQVPPGQTWTGTLNLPGAPDTANLNALQAGTSVGNFIGSNSWGPLQIVGPDQLVVSATGLIPNTNYIMQFIGSAVTDATPLVTYPQAYADAVSVSTEGILLAGPISLAISTFSQYIITAQPKWRSFWVVCVGSSPPTTLELFGLQSGAQYQAFLPPYFVAGVTFYRFALVGVESTLQLDITASSSSALTVWYGADLSPIDTAVYTDGNTGLPVINFVNVPNKSMSPLGVYVLQGDYNYHNPALPVGLTSIGIGGNANTQVVIKSITKSSVGSPGAGIIIEGSSLAGVPRARFLDNGSATTPINSYYLDLGGLLFQNGENVVLNNTTAAPLDVSIQYDVVKSFVQIG